MKITGGHFEGNGTAISISKGANLEVDDTKFVRNGIGIHERDPIVDQANSLFQDMPVGELVALLERLSKEQPATVEAAAQTVTATGAERYLAAGSNLMSVANVLYDWYQKGLIGDLITGLLA